MSKVKKYWDRFHSWMGAPSKIPRGVVILAFALTVVFAVAFAFELRETGRLLLIAEGPTLTSDQMIKRNEVESQLRQLDDLQEKMKNEFAFLDSQRFNRHFTVKDYNHMNVLHDLIGKVNMFYKYYLLDNLHLWGGRVPDFAHEYLKYNKVEDSVYQELYKAVDSNNPYKNARPGDHPVYHNDGPWIPEPGSIDGSGVYKQPPLRLK